MKSNRYTLIDSKGNELAVDMDIHTAVLLMEAYCASFCGEDISLTLQLMEDALLKSE